jgi:hypothetical protein
VVIAAGDVPALAAGLNALLATAPTLRDAARASVAHLGLAAMAERLQALYRMC